MHRDDSSKLQIVNPILGSSFGECNLTLHEMNCEDQINIAPNYVSENSGCTSQRKLQKSVGMKLRFSRCKNSSNSQREVLNAPIFGSKMENQYRSNNPYTGDRAK